MADTLTMYELMGWERTSGRESKWNWRRRWRRRSKEGSARSAYVTVTSSPAAMGLIAAMLSTPFWNFWIAFGLHITTQMSVIEDYRRLSLQS